MQASPLESNGRPRKILFPEGSSTSARQALYSLGPEDIVDCLDPNPLCQCRFSRRVRRWYRCPHYATDPLGYLRFLANRLQSEHYDVLLPTHEQVYLLSRVGDLLNQYTRVALPDFAVLRRLQDKAEFIRLLEEIGLPYPPTVIVGHPDQLQEPVQFPCFVKLAHGTAGLGVRQVNDAAELAQFADQTARQGLLDAQTEFLVQQPATGDLSVAFAIFQHGRMVAHHMTRVRVYGVGNVARTSANQPGIAEDLQRLGGHLNWHGALFVDYFYDAATGRRQYLEANPRLGETLNARLCGRNLCEQFIRVSLGQHVQPLAVGETGVRSHQGYLLGLARALEGRSRRQVLGEVLRARRQRGFYEHSEDELARPDEDWLSLLPAGAVLAQLALAPRLAHRIVRRAVEDYGLPGPAARAIGSLPQEQLDACF